MHNNEELIPVKTSYFTTENGAGTLEKVDDHSIKITFSDPYYLFIDVLAGATHLGGHAYQGPSARGMFAPAHYMEQFHPNYIGEDEANELAEDAGFENWVTYFKNRIWAWTNPEVPTLTPWVVKTPNTSTTIIMERNPYYFAVDTEGNQLPYIDSVHLTLAQNNEVLNLSALAGNYTVMGRHINLAKLPLFLENAESVGYRVQFWRQPQSGIANLYINETWDGNAEIQSFLQNIEFRRALSMGIERDQINEVFFLGIGQTSGLCQGYPDPDNPGKYVGEGDVQFNPDTANAILDEIGLDQKDGDGFRLMPSGEKLTIQMPAVVAAFEDYPGINEMIARQWEVNIGVHAEVQSLERGLHGNRGRLNELMLTNWESSPRSTTLITPGHLLPVGGGGNTGRLYGDWHMSGGERGIEPTNAYLREQMTLYDESQTTATSERAAEILQRVVTLNCLNVNPITTVMNKPTYVAIIKNNVRNIPNPLPFSYHNQTSGNGHPEQWWIDDENAMMGK
jgi:peptide/nickel transport system substrate-binding protein